MPQARQAVRQHVRKRRLASAALVPDYANDVSHDADGSPLVGRWPECADYLVHRMPPKAEGHGSFGVLSHGRRQGEQKR